MILPWRLTLAHHLDWWEQRLRRIGEKLGYPQAWLHEFIAYRGDPRMTIEEFWVRYTLLRMDAEKVLKPHMSEAEAHSFYEKHSYMCWRNLVHRRHSAWRRVLCLMPARGKLYEFGCGVAPISIYVAQRRPLWWYWLVDVPSPHRKYGEWRVRQHAHVGSGESPHAMYLSYDVVTAVDVFEHLADPKPIAESLCEAVKAGGYLLWNIHHNPAANDLDLSSKEQLDATGRYLESALHVVWAKDEYRVGRKP